MVSAQKDIRHSRLVILDLQQINGAAGKSQRTVKHCYAGKITAFNDQFTVQKAYILLVVAALYGQMTVPKIDLMLNRTSAYVVLQGDFRAVDDQGRNIVAAYVLTVQINGKGAGINLEPV